VNFAVSKKNYPVYQKESSFNTEKNFDDGVFEEIATKLKSTNLAITSFGYVFPKEGVYVFADVKNNDNQTVVVISKTLSPTGFFPLTKKNMNTYKVKPIELELQALPDGLYFIGIAFFILAFVLLLIQEIVFMQLAKAEKSK
jgi:hypothetical protein